MGTLTFVLSFSLNASTNNYVLVSGLVNQVDFLGNCRNCQAFVQTSKQLLFAWTRVSFFFSSPLKISVEDSDPEYPFRNSKNCKTQRSIKSFQIVVTIASLLLHYIYMVGTGQMFAGTNNNINVQVFQITILRRLMGLEFPSYNVE